jgi:hypothetical protein
MLNAKRGLIQWLLVASVFCEPVVNKQLSSSVNRFVVCSSGGSGSYALFKFLKQWGATGHCHSRSPPAYLSPLGGAGISHEVPAHSVLLLRTNNALHPTFAHSRNSHMHSYSGGTTHGAHSVSGIYTAYDFLLAPCHRPRECWCHICFPEPSGTSAVALFARE